MLGLILAQVFGAVALILICISYFAKNKLKFHLLQIGADIFYGFAFFVVNSYVAGIITLISSIRCLYLYIAEKHNFKYKNHFLTIFILAYAGVTIGFWQSWLDLIPLFTAIMFAIAYACKNLQLLRYLSLAPNLILAGFNIYTQTYVSAILDLIEFCVIIVAIIKFKKSAKDNQNTAPKVE